MEMNSHPAYVKAACFLTDSLALDLETIDDLELDIDLKDFQEINENFFQENSSDFTVDWSYILIPKGRAKDLVSNLYKNNQTIVAQDILEFLSSDTLEKSAEIESKSFRVSLNCYFRVVKRALQEHLSLANVVRDKFKERILEFIEGLEGEVDISEGKKEFLLEELDDWMREKSPKEEYNVPFKYYGGGDEKMIEGEHIFAKEHIENKLEHYLSEKAYEEYKEEVREKLEFKSGIRELSLLDQLDTRKRHFNLRMNEGHLELFFPRMVTLHANFGTIEELDEYFEGLEYGEEIDSALWKILQPEGVVQTTHGDQLDIYSRPFDEDLLNFKIDFNKDGELIVEGVSIDRDGFKDEIVEIKKEQWVDELRDQSDNKENIQEKVKDLMDKGKYKEAKQLNEKIVAKEKMDDYLYFVVSFLLDLESQVITISGIKNIMLFVEAMKDLYGFEEIIQEG